MCEKLPAYWRGLLEVSGVLDQEVARFSLSSRPETAGIVGGSEVVVSRADWSLARSGENFRGEGKLKDTLDVADLASEAEHDYEMHMPLIGLEPANLLTRKRSPDGEVILDGGRELPGAEEFTITNLSPNRPVEVVMRTTDAPFALQVQADGKNLGEWPSSLPVVGGRRPPLRYLRNLFALEAFEYGSPPRKALR